MDWKLFASTFGAIFLAELGDKTQLAAVLVTAKTGKPWVVFLAASLALVLVSAIGVAFAAFLADRLPAELIKKVAAGLFVVLGVLMYFDKI